MEQGDSSSRHGQDANPSSGSFSFANTRAPAPPINPINDALIPRLVVQDKNTLPVTNVTKIMRKALPFQAKISDDTKEFVQQCTTEYLSYVTKKANERCQREYRKIVKGDDLLWALESLGFVDYVSPLALYLQRFRASEANRKRGEPIPPGLMQGTDNNLSGLGPVEPVVEISQPTLSAVEIAQPNFPAPPAAIGPNFSIEPSPNMELFDQIDLDKFCDGFGPFEDFDYDSLLREEDDGKTNWDAKNNELP